MRRLLPLLLVLACNQPPGTPGVAIEPAEPTTADELTLVLDPESFDPNTRDVVSYQIRWFEDGEELTDLAQARAVPSRQTRRGRTFSVEVTPTDGKEAGLPATAEVTIVNAPPEVRGVSLSPIDVRTDGTLTASFDGWDDDDDILEPTYTWRIDGAVIDHSGRTLEGDRFARGDQVSVGVTLNDGTVNSEELVSDRVTVLNSPPTPPNIGLPEESSTVDDLHCVITAEGTDPDDDPLEYRFAWDVDGRTATAEGTTDHPGDTVLASQTAKDEVWTCEVEATDGEAFASVVSASTLIKDAVVPGFDGEKGPVLDGWVQCAGYRDTLAGSDDVPDRWGNLCTDVAYRRVAVACGASESSFRYITVEKNVFAEGLTGYSETGLISGMYDQSGSPVSYTGNTIYAEGNNPNGGRSWWVTGSGCSESTLSLTINNYCSWEAANCFGQNLSGDRSLWVYVQE